MVEHGGLTLDDTSTGKNVPSVLIVIFADEADVCAFQFELLQQFGSHFAYQNFDLNCAIIHLFIELNQEFPFLLLFLVDGLQSFTFSPLLLKVVVRGLDVLAEGLLCEGEVLQAKLHDCHGRQTLIAHPPGVAF